MSEVGEPDVVEELDEWLARWRAFIKSSGISDSDWGTEARMQRARDEIVALRDGYTREQMREACRNNYNAGRAEAWEEAAVVCEEAANHPHPVFHGTAHYCAAAIRTLKDKRDE